MMNPYHQIKLRRVRSASGSKNKVGPELIGMKNME